MSRECTGPVRSGGGTPRRRGYSLVEVLVALTLLGRISVALVTGLRFGARAWEHGDTRLAAGRLAGAFSEA